VTRRKNMELLGFYIFGNSGKTLVELCVIGFLMGTCIAFFVVIGDLCPILFGKIFNIQNMDRDALRRWLICLVTVTCIIPLSFQKSIQSLSFVCKASIGFYVCLTLKTVVESFSRFQTDEHWMSNIELWNVSGIVQCIPIFTMAMSCQMQLFEVYENISSFDRIRQNIFHATLICLCCYTVIGFFGYVAFYNQNLSGNILVNFEPSLANDVITFGFILSIACSFPLVIFPCRSSLASLLHRKVHHSEISPYIPESRYKPLTLFIIFSTMTLGILVPSVEVIIGFVGSTIGTMICIIFPATCFVKIMQRSSSEKAIAQCIIVVGFVVMILGTYSNLNALDVTRSVEVHNVNNVNNVVVVHEPNEQIMEKEKEISELKASKDKLEQQVLEMKEELVKQNEETQKLVLQKFDEIAEKVDKIEKQSQDSVETVRKAVPGDGERRNLTDVPKDPVIYVTAVEEKKVDKNEEVLEVVDKIEVKKLDTSGQVELKAHESSDKDEKAPENNDLQPLVNQQAFNDTKAHESHHREEKKLENELPEAPAIKDIEKPKEKLKAHDSDMINNAQKLTDDPIIKLLQSQAPLSYQVGEKLTEEKKNGTSKVRSVENDDLGHKDVMMEMRKRRQVDLNDVESSFKDSVNMQINSIITRDLKAFKDRN
jgi:solute carrier family 38 (sodium-coupled neutral amino acid transporter), member 10